MTPVKFIFFLKKKNSAVKICAWIFWSILKFKLWCHVQWTIGTCKKRTFLNLIIRSLKKDNFTWFWCDAWTVETMSRWKWIFIPRKIMLAALLGVYSWDGITLHCSQYAFLTHLPVKVDSRDCFRDILVEGTCKMFLLFTSKTSTENTSPPLNFICLSYWQVRGNHQEKSGGHARFFSVNDSTMDRQAGLPPQFRSGRKLTVSELRS